MCYFLHCPRGRGRHDHSRNNQTCSISVFLSKVVRIPSSSHFLAGSWVSGWFSLAALGIWLCDPMGSISFMMPLPNSAPWMPLPTLLLHLRMFCSHSGMTSFIITGSDLHVFVTDSLSLAKTKSENEVIQLCPTLFDLMDCSLPVSSIHGIFQVRVLEWVAISLSRGSS